MDTKWRNEPQRTLVRPRCYTRAACPTRKSSNSSSNTEPTSKGRTSTVKLVSYTRRTPRTFASSSSFTEPKWILQDSFGDLALHHAISRNEQSTLRMLIDHGSDPYLKNKLGEDAIQTASEAMKRLRKISYCSLCHRNRAESNCTNISSSRKTMMFKLLSIILRKQSIWEMNLLTSLIKIWPRNLCTCLHGKSIMRRRWKLSVGTSTRWTCTDSWSGN